MTGHTKNYAWLDDEGMDLLRTLASVTRLRTHVVLRALLRQAYTITMTLPFESMDPRVTFVKSFPDYLATKQDNQPEKAS